MGETSKCEEVKNNRGKPRSTTTRRRTTTIHQGLAKTTKTYNKDSKKTRTKGLQPDAISSLFSILKIHLAKRHRFITLVLVNLGPPHTLGRLGDPKKPYDIFLLQEDTYRKSIG
jgi:hypothetical protein